MVSDQSSLAGAGGPVVRVLLCMHHWEQLVAQRKGTAPIISSLGLGFANLCPHLSMFGLWSVVSQSKFSEDVSLTMVPYHHFII